MIPMAENCFTLYIIFAFFPGGEKVLFLAVFFWGDGVISFSECFHVHTKILELLGNGQWDRATGVTRQFLRNHFSV